MKHDSSSFKVAIVLSVLLVLSLGFHLASLIPSENSPRGFILPPGDADHGLLAFEQLGCVSCHTLHGVEFKPTATPTDFEKVPLGGEIPLAITYGELVTSIIHPSESIRTTRDHRFADANGHSLMVDLNNRMTTRQMIDIVTLLQNHYEVVHPEPVPGYTP